MRRMHYLSIVVAIVALEFTAIVAIAQTPEAGRQVFATRCATCHGTEGTGGEFGPSIVTRIPLRNDQELETVIREGLPGAGMPASQNLSAPEATSLVAFLRTLRPRSIAGPQRTTVTLAGGKQVPGVVLNQSAGEMQLLGDDRAVHLLRETAAGRHREVTSQTGWPTYNGNPNGNRYSTLGQITAANASHARPEVDLHAAERRATAGDAGGRGRRDVRHRRQRPVRARRRQRAADLELPEAAHAGAGGCGGAWREPRRGGRR